MNAREVIQGIKSQLKVKEELEDKDFQVDIIGTSKLATGVISYWVEGKLRQIKVDAEELPDVE